MFVARFEHTGSSWGGKKGLSLFTLCGGDFYTLFGVKLAHDTVLGER
jgi:hypothetical protein